MKTTILFILISIWAIYIAFVPVIVGYETQTSEKLFTGRTYTIHTFYSSLDFMNQAKEGHLVFTTHRTGEMIGRYFILLPFFIVGKMASLGMDMMMSYFLNFLAWSLIMCLSIFLIITEIIKDKYQQILAYLMSLVGGGFGFVYWILYKTTGVPLMMSESIPISARMFPIDLYLSDAFPILSMASYMHHVAAISIICISLYFFLRSTRENDLFLAFVSGLMTFVLSLCHIYDVVIVFSIVLIYSFVKKSYLEFVVYSLISIIPTLIVYRFYIFDSVFYKLSDLNLVLTPNPFSIIIGLGLLFFMSLPYLRMKEKPLFPMVWGFTYFILLYLPVTFQARFSMGLVIPFAVMSSYWLKNQRKVVIFFVMLLVVISPMLFITKETAKLSIPEYEQHYYVNTTELDAVEWLSHHTDDTDVVLADIYSSDIIASRNIRVFVSSNYAMTLDWKNKKEYVDRFLETKNISMIKNTNATMVYAKGYTLPLYLIYKNKDINIYEYK